MSTPQEATSDSPMSLLVGEINAQMGRLRLSQVALSRRIGQSQPWLNRRLMGHTEMTVADVTVIAEAMGTTFFELVDEARRASLKAHQGPARSTGGGALFLAPPSGLEPETYRTTPEGEVVDLAEHASKRKREGRSTGPYARTRGRSALSSSLAPVQILTVCPAN